MQELESRSVCSDHGRNSPTSLDTVKSSVLDMSNQNSPTSCCETGRPIMTDPHTGQTVCSCQVDSRLLSYPRLATGLPVSSIYGPAYSEQGYVSFGADHSAFYSPLNNTYDLKDGSTAAWSSLTQAAAYYSYDPTIAAYPYSNGYGGVDLNGAARRKNATKEVTSTLKAWLYEHRKNPYPTKGEKIMLAIITKMTLTQVSTWFANARRRLKKENKMTWEPRNRVDDDDKSDVENDNEPSSKDGPDLSPRGDKKDRYGHHANGGLHLCDKSQDSDDLMLGKSCVKDNLSLDPDSRSCSPASPLSLSSHTGLSQSSLGALSDPSPSPDLGSAVKTSDHKPRIWSLAHTATSNSPPLSRKSPQPSPLHGLVSSHHHHQAYHHPVTGFTSMAAAAGGKVGVGMTMGGMTASQYHHHQGTNITSRPDLRTWIEGAFHGASALTAMGIAAQYHGLVSSANSLGVHHGTSTTSGANPCMTGAATAGGGVSAIPTNGVHPSVMPVASTAGLMAMDRLGTGSLIGSVHNNVGGASVNHAANATGMTAMSRPVVTTTSTVLDSSTNHHHHHQSSQNLTGSSFNCRLAPSSNGSLAGHKIGFSSPCSSNVSPVGQSPLLSKTNFCNLNGDHVGIHSSLQRTSSQSDVVGLSTAFRPVTKTS